jgi:hypothetical protein
LPGSMTSRITRSKGSPTAHFNPVCNAGLISRRAAEPQRKEARGRYVSPPGKSERHYGRRIGRKLIGCQRSVGRSSEHLAARDGGAVLLEQDYVDTCWTG